MLSEKQEKLKQMLLTPIHCKVQMDFFQSVESC